MPYLKYRYSGLAAESPPECDIEEKELKKKNVFNRLSQSTRLQVSVRSRKELGARRDRIAHYIANGNTSSVPRGT